MSRAWIKESKTMKRFATLFAAATAISLSTCVPAIAEPVLEADLAHTPAAMPRNDEQLTYVVKVKNVASPNPSIGDEFFCNGIETSPSLPKNWNPGTPGEPGFPAFSFEWRRNGAVIPGETAQTYTAAAADQGTVIQCLVKGTNSTSGAKYAAQPGVTVSPLPAIPPPAPSDRVNAGSRPTIVGSGTATRTCVAPGNWSGVARATTSAGSATLTNVVTAAGTGTLTAGSATVTGVKTTTGPFLVGQTIVGTGIPAGTTIAAVGSGTLELSAAATASGVTQALSAGAQPFAAGQTITGNGIPAGTTVVAVSGQTLTLSASATASATGVAVSSPATATWTYQWLRNGDEIAGATGSTYTPVVGAGEPDQDKILQCMVIVTNAGGSLVGISNNSAVGTVEKQAILAVLQNPATEFSNSTAGLVKVDFELPAGEETRVFKFSASGWTCATQEPSGLTRARIVCERANALEPQLEYPAIEVATSIGADAPDPAIASVTVSGGGAATVGDQDAMSWLPATPFSIKSFTTKVIDAAGADYTQAGGHPFSASASVALSTRVDRTGDRAQIEFLKTVKTDTPPGFIGNPQAAPRRCETIDTVLLDAFAAPTCPRESIVGSVTVDTSATKVLPGLPIYMLDPEPGVPAQLVFAIRGIPASFTLIPRLRPEDGYAISVDVAPASKNPVIYSAAVTLCSYGVNVEGTAAGSLANGAPRVTSCKKAGDAGAYPKPFLTNPTQCSDTPPVTRISIDSWDQPGVFKSAEAVSPKVTGCDIVPFNPSASLQPSAREADSPTGLDVSIEMPTDGLESPNGIAQGNLKRAVVTLPEGMTVNPSAADGLGACTQAELGMSNGVPNDEPVRCPESSKVGSAVIKTPILAEALEGSVYLAKQGDNPFHSLLALYLVAESKERGILVKLPGKVTADPVTGQLVSTFDDNPQAPIESVDLHFDSGSRAALLMPPKCGSYEIRTELSPWSAKDPDAPSAAEVRSSTSTFAVGSGPGGGPCPNGSLAPKLKAGLTSPVAGAKSPFTMSLGRDDGTQRFSSLELTMPPGLTAYLKGVPYCPDAVVAAIPSALGTGAAELASPSCPAASQIGSVSVGAGGGPNPFYVHTGRVYLTGPYKGAPLSLAIVTPAVAGPFDLGNVVVKTALYVNPATAQITAKSDPIPTILHGISLHVRDVRVNVDRPGFTLAPTNCEPMAVGAKVGGQGGASASVSYRFQVGECRSLAFRPGLSTRVIGGTKRGDNPRFRAIVTAKPGEANIARAAVTLPHSEFLDQSHINTICTRVQFAADNCPKGSIYGNAKAFSPLLDYPVSGPVYLRSSSNPLPDLVVALRGPSYQPLEVDLVGRVDSINGGIRNRFELVPDAPVSKFILNMKGGKKGLLVNSRDLCKSVNRSTVRMTGQNGMTHNFRPVLENDCGGKAKKKSSKRHR